MRLRHMRDAAREAADFARRQPPADLDAMRWFGLVKCIEIVGEAASRVTSDFRQRHPEIPWADVVGMRHRLVHAYDQVDYDIVWKAAIEDMPPLVATIERILAAGPGKPDPTPG